MPGLVKLLLCKENFMLCIKKKDIVDLGHEYATLLYLGAIQGNR